MITLNDYLYSGDTVLKILQRYHNDLKEDAKKTQNGMDMIHCNFLLQLMELLEHNDFLTSQSQRLREFYKYMSSEYPFLAFTFKGRIKSLIRAEQKFNGNIVEHVYDYYEKNTSFPSITELKQQIGPIRDLIAYRIVISMPVCHLKDGVGCTTPNLSIRLRTTLKELSTALCTSARMAASTSESEL